MRFPVSVVPAGWVGSVTEVDRVGGRPGLAHVPLEVLVADVEARTQSLPDLGLVEAVCPRCSSVKVEVFGSYSRLERRFRCDSCRVSLWETGYELELDRFEAWRARARRDGQELDALMRRPH